MTASTSACSTRETASRIGGPCLRAARSPSSSGGSNCRGLRMAKNAYADFMAQAYTMELEATERYAQFAEQLDTHNNREVADLFRKLSAIEALHAKRILEEMGWPSLPALTPAFAWEGSEGP